MLLFTGCQPEGTSSFRVVLPPGTNAPTTSRTLNVPPVGTTIGASSPTVVLTPPPTTNVPPTDTSTTTPSSTLNVPNQPSTPTTTTTTPKPPDNQTTTTVPPNVSTPPDPVTGLTAEAKGVSEIELKWNGTSFADYTCYNVYRSTSEDGYFSFLYSPTDAKYTDTDLVQSFTYYYYVTVARAGKVSERSEIASATTDAPVVLELFGRDG